jgi:hypothetical protein
MNDLYCIVGITLLLSSIMMSIMKTDKNIFINFDNLLDNKQKAKYRKIIKERTCIYISGLILGLLCGLYYLYSYKKDSKRLCKFIIIVYVVQLGFYYFLPKSPLMLYSLNTNEQKDAWADIYTEMKRRWKLSLLLGFVGTLLIGNFIMPSRGE